MPLDPGRCRIFNYVIFKHFVANDIKESFSETALSKMLMKNFPEEI